MTRVLSGIQPTGETHLGNYVGALRNWVAMQDQADTFYCLVDLHALTILDEPGVLAERTLRQAAVLFAAGLDPDRTTVFVQSHVVEHNQLGWIMECTASFGELNRMTQFKEKTAKRQRDHVSAGLFTYPALQAADILLYDTEKVPVGADQKQHIELCRDAAERFNGRYGTEEQPIFVMPVHSTPAAGARVMDLQHPDKKMSKSLDSPQGTVLVLDDAKSIEKKFKRAVTDSEGVVRYAPDDPDKAGVTNLLSILAGATGDDPEALASKYEQYGPLKADAAAAVIEQLVPIQERYATLVADPAELDRLLAVGADKAEAIAAPVLHRATTAMGLGRG